MQASGDSTKAVENSTQHTSEVGEKRVRKAQMRPRPRMVWRFHVLPMLAALLALFGIAIASYPPMAQWFSQYQQSQIVNSYSSTVATGLDPSSEEQFTEAREYNEALSVGALLEANTNVPKGAGN